MDFKPYISPFRVKSRCLRNPGMFKRWGSAKFDNTMSTRCLSNRIVNVVIEQILVLLFRRLTTPEIRPTSRRKSSNFLMVFTNQFFYNTFMAIIALDDRFTHGVNQCFLSGECRKK